MVTTVIGHNHDKGWVLLMPAGWLCHAIAAPPHRIPIMAWAHCATTQVVGGIAADNTNQEHRIIALPRDGTCPPEIFHWVPCRILPNHACATAAMHAHTIR
ncbi:hypothetical protein WDV93_13770 [Pantoea ananatis]